MGKIIINGVDLEIDLLDADEMEKYQESLRNATAAIQKMQDDMNSETQAQKIPELMRAQCRITENFIDEIFGEGISKKCFPRPNHLGDHLNAFTDLCYQAKEASVEAKNITNKYSQERIMNREQSRNQKKRKKNNPAYCTQ